mmetsp:Transcript_31678/g.80584  ORF Transcript_31678/g.80584 Transcript_31678/m.80584 type:complete len:236 (+) Transcript_31678:603-1310(+)
MPCGSSGAWSRTQRLLLCRLPGLETPESRAWAPRGAVRALRGGQIPPGDGRGCMRLGATGGGKHFFPQDRGDGVLARLAGVLGPRPKSCPAGCPSVRFLGYTAVATCRMEELPAAHTLPPPYPPARAHAHHRRATHHLPPHPRRKKISNSGAEGDEGNVYARTNHPTYLHKGADLLPRTGRPAGFPHPAHPHPVKDPPAKRPRRPPAWSRGRARVTKNANKLHFVQPQSLWLRIR